MVSDGIGVDVRRAVPSGGAGARSAARRGFADAVHAKAARLAALPRDSLAEAKRLVVGPDRERMKAVIDAENEALARLSGGPANREAVAAFREKRKPDFAAL